MRLPVLPWPGEEKPCNGCGLCCAAEPCSIAVEAGADGPGPCPFLTAHDGRWWCALVECEARAGLPPLIADALAIGTACDSDFNHAPITEAEAAARLATMTPMIPKGSGEPHP